MQQINLYTDEFRPAKKYFSARSTLISSVIVIVFLIVLSLFISASVKDFSKSVYYIQRIDENKKVNLEKIKSKMQINNTGNVKQKIYELQKEYEEKLQLKNIIKNQREGNLFGYSDALYALSSSSIDSVQINRITFSNGLQLVEFEGVAKEPKNVSEYMELLQNNIVFNESKFGLMTIDNDPKNSDGSAKYKIGYSQIKGDE